MKPDTCKFKYSIVYRKRSEDDLWCPVDCDGYYIVQERVKGLFRYRWETIWFENATGQKEFRISTEELARDLLEEHKRPKEIIIYQE